MKRILGLILAVLMTGLSPAISQQFPTVPDHTVIGRIGTGSGSGPSQAIPFATLAQQIGAATTCTVGTPGKYPTLAAAIAACPSNAAIIIQSPQTISTSISVAGAAITIQCVNGAVLTYTTAGRIAISGANSGMKDCILTGAGVGSPGQQAFLGSGDNLVFSGNVVTNFGSTSSNGTVEIAAGSHLTVTKNVIRNNADFGLFVNNALAGGTTMADISIIDNEIRNGLVVHATTTGSINEVMASLNRLYAGENSNTEFCLETGNFGGTSVGTVTSTGNKCKLLANGTNGGYSYGAVSRVISNSNMFDNGGFTFTVNGMEIAAATVSVVANDNNLTCGSGGNCLSVSSASNNVNLVGNQINGFIGGTSHYGILVGISGTAGVASVALVNSNRITFSTGAAGQAIWFQCNITGATCSNYTAVGNEIISDGTANSTGIQFDRVSGATMDGLLVGPNMLISPANGVVVASGVTNVCLVPGMNEAATAVTNNGSASTCAPAWRVPEGGTGLAVGVSGGLPYYNSTATMASSALQVANQIMLGGGAGAAPATLGSLGTTSTVLHGNASGAPTFGAVVSPDMNITATNCTNQFVSAISTGGIGTCTTDTLASAQHANQGTATTVLHGNGAGNPSFGAVALTTDVAGTLPIANGGTGDTGTAWTSYTPSVATGSGTITTQAATGFFKTIGKTTFFEAKLVITTNGTGATSIILGLPNTSLHQVVFIGAEVAVNGSIIKGVVAANGSTITMQIAATNVYPGGDGFNIIVNGVYEST